MHSSFSFGASLCRDLEGALLCSRKIFENFFVFSLAMGFSRVVLEHARVRAAASDRAFRCAFGASLGECAREPGVEPACAVEQIDKRNDIGRSGCSIAIDVGGPDRARRSDTVDGVNQRDDVGGG